MNIKDEFKEYTDADGLIQNNKNPKPHDESGNGILYTAEYLIILKNEGELDSYTQEHYDNQVFPNCQVVPGLFKRSPTHTDQIGPDDLVGIASYASGSNLPMADSILSYGRDNRVKFGPFKIPYVYNNVCPGTFKKPDGKTNWSAIFLRQPTLIIHFKVSANEKLNLLEKLIWSVGVAYNGFSKPEDQDPWMLTSLLVNSYHNYVYKSYFMDKACKSWHNKFMKSPYGNFETLLTKYFGFDHKISKYWDNVFSWIK